MTATPERADGLDILRYFDGRIAAELRVWDAIDQQYLVPFSYFGVHDGTDLSEVPWKRGAGYDRAALTNVLTPITCGRDGSSSSCGARPVIHRAIRAPAFCVSIGHARFMAEQFRAAGIAAVAIWGDSPMDDRTAALRDLAAGRVNVVFTVDLFNEGVDVPNVDTLLLLRPTESPTLFLQQLGRGLRRADKALCTVLDFVGNHRASFGSTKASRPSRRHSPRSRASRRARFSVFAQRMPHGARSSRRDIVLRSIRQAIPSDWRAKCDELRSLGDVSLATYLDETGLELEDIYAKTGAGARSAEPSDCQRLTRVPKRTRCYGLSDAYSTSTTVRGSTPTDRWWPL